MASQQAPAPGRLGASVRRRVASCACALVLLLAAGRLAGCGGDDEGGGGLGGMKRSGGGDVEGGGGPPRGMPPALRPAPAAQKPDDFNNPKVAPPSAEELARKKAAWEDFLEHRENPIVAPAIEDAAPRTARAPLAATPGVPASLDPRMKAWYADYRVVSTSVKLALSRYTEALGARDDGGLLAACRELKSSTQRLLGDPTAFASPDAMVNQNLRAAYQSFHAGADSCLAGQAGGRDAFIAVSQQLLLEATDVLRPYRLAP